MPEPTPEFIEQMETFAKNLFDAVAPMMRQNVRAVLEANDKLVNQDEFALNFLTEEIVNALMRPNT